MLAGNIAVLVIELALIGVVVVFGMKQYISFRKTPFYASSTAWLGWFLCFSIVFLVPVDILATDHNQCLEKHVNQTGDFCHEPITYVPESLMLAQWKVLYWGTFIFSWAIFPVLQTFSVTGDFRFQERLWRAIKDNIILYIFMGIAGLIFVIVLFALKNMTLDGLISLVMSLANAYGLVLVVITMGFGLVDLPRNLLRQSDKYKTLRHYRVDAVVLRNDLEQSQSALNDHLRLIKATSDAAGEYDPYRPYLDIIISKCPLEFAMNDNTPSSVSVDSELSYDKLVSMHSTLMDLVHQNQRATVMYDRLLGKGFATEDIIDTIEVPAKTREKKIKWSFKHYSKNPNKVLFEYYWIVYIHPALYKFLGVVCSIMSLLIVWSELSLAFKGETKNYSPFALVINNSGDSLNGIGLQIFCFIPLLYMTICAYTTLFKFRIFNYYRLVPQQQTNAMSIMFSAKLAAPLSFNFIQICALSDASFNAVMGEMDAFSLGKNFIFFFPIFVAVVCLVSLFNVHKRVASCCCIPQLRIVTDTSDAAVEKGMRILKEEREARTGDGGVLPPKPRVMILKEFFTGKKDKSKDTSPTTKDGANSNHVANPSSSFYKPEPKSTRIIQGLSRDYSSKSGNTYKSSGASSTNNNNNISINGGGGNNNIILNNANTSSSSSGNDRKSLLSNYWDKLNKNSKPFYEDDDDDDYDVEMGSLKK
ncbi:hypothetical protein DFA_02744 [Cavenderia fasciculata]|uniref:LMBR1-like membrane protein n=1 Tax=Cavenderia fasciculata TaxID=261658 RepID=F4PI14_CACFS|nr:uncharacterized protein DFA_02744 [Cavenderia fasciculata]EGG24501.1 hypothetical protein DFA_02744 [Cavenderia fasciculata]|eukprot:XP_004362352.1 hypothetical protein DFA_02744 [Cavenderia fasciculata]